MNCRQLGTRPVPGLRSPSTAIRNRWRSADQLPSIQMVPMTFDNENDSQYRYEDRMSSMVEKNRDSRTRFEDATDLREGSAMQA